MYQIGFIRRNDIYIFGSYIIYVYSRCSPLFFAFRRVVFLPLFLPSLFRPSLLSPLRRFSICWTGLLLLFHASHIPEFVFSVRLSFFILLLFSCGFLFILFRLDQFEHYFVFTSFIYPPFLYSVFLANILNLFINLCVNHTISFLLSRCCFFSRFAQFYATCAAKWGVFCCLSSHHFDSLAVPIPSIPFFFSVRFVPSTESCKSKEEWNGILKSFGFWIFHNAFKLYRLYVCLCLCWFFFCSMLSNIWKNNWVFQWNYALCLFARFGFVYESNDASLSSMKETKLSLSLQKKMHKNANNLRQLDKVSI